MPNELGDFLRARRTDASLGPSGGHGGRRRITGLRREEVASAAGISVDYYTRLEQGHETHPSDSVLQTLSRVLHLDSDAEQHLYQLRETRPTPARESHEDHNLLIRRMMGLVEAVRPNPAYVLDRLSNMVAANTEGLALYEGFAELPAEQRNTCRYLVTDPRAREIFVEWEELARGAIAHLRAANADHLQDPELQSLVTELRARSPLFEECWSEHIVQRRRASIKHLRMGTDNVIARRYEVLHIPEEELRMTLWMPGI